MIKLFMLLLLMMFVCDVWMTLIGFSDTNVLVIPLLASYYFAF